MLFQSRDESDHHIVTAFFSLSAWFMRRAWPMVLLLGLGMLAGILLACMVPLLTYASLTTSLHHALAQPYRNTMVVTDANLSPDEIAAITPHLDTVAQTTISPYVSRQASLALRSPDFALVHTNDMMHFKAFPPDYLIAHFSLAQGRFPADAATMHEVVLSQQSAAALHVQVGDMLAFSPPDSSQHTKTIAPVAVQIVGIITPVADDIHDPFDTEPVDPVQSGNQFTYTALLSDMSFLDLFADFTPSTITSVQAMWVYTIVPDFVTETNFALVQNRVQIFNQRVAQTLSPYQGTISVYGNALLTLEGYDNRVSATRLPLIALLIQMLVLVVWFIVTMTDLLIERQADAIALYRSRGASAWQLTFAILLPCAVIGIICGIVGPMLALPATGWVANQLTPATDVASIIATFAAQPFFMLRDLAWYSLGVVGVLLLTLLLTLARALQRNIVQLRQEQSRATQQPLWQRLHLDIIGAFAALALYTTYLVFIGANTDPTTYALLAPFAIYAPICLMIAGVLLATRLLPWLMRRSIPLAARYRGIVPLLTSVNLAQARQKMIQVTSFFALAIALGAFVLSYHVSQDQHDQDYAAFHVGADFSGNLPINLTQEVSYQQQQALFQQMPGVRAASLGAIIDIYGSATSLLPKTTRLLAVDAGTYSQVGSWPKQTGTSLPQLMQRLVSQRASATAQGAIPAIVDDALWQELQLTPGAPFSFDIGSKDSLRLHFIALQRVDHIPMTDDMAGYVGSTITGGMLVDFPTLATMIHTVDPKQSAPPGYIWLKTASDTASINQIRRLLHQAPYEMAGVNDRYQMLDDIRLAPLGMAIEGITSVGAFIAIILALFALVYTLIGTWQQRLLNLTALYALGARRTQLMSVLLLENGVLLFIGAFIGIVLGTQLAGAIVPLITYAQAGDIHQQIIDLLVPPPRVIIPWPLILISVGSFLALCPTVMYIMARSTIQNQASVNLRLNED
jgi:ABC-type lipoprotein release transport system permease subunit